MYTLREIENDKSFIQANYILGETYSFYSRESMNNDSNFLDYLNFYMNKEYNKEYTMERIDELNIKGFIVAERCVHLLYAESNYYIMTDTGKTFESINFNK